MDLDIGMRLSVNYVFDSERYYGWHAPRDKRDNGNPHGM